MTAGISRRLRAVLIGICLIPLVAWALLLIVLALVDNGYGDRTIRSTVSQRLGREVQFSGIEARLLSRDPTIVLHDLAIGNPAWLPRRPMARVGQFQIHLLPWPLLSGRLRVDALRLSDLRLDLVRFGPGKNNWAIHPGGSGPAFAPLAGVRRFTIDRGTIVFRDFKRDLLFRGTFDHRSDETPAFRIAGAGRLKGGGISFRATGGPLNGAAVGKPYPFSASLVDGATLVDATGTSGDAFDLSSYALRVHASGPNLADVGYLFHLITPNTAPFVATTRAFSDGTHLRFDRLAVRVGQSRIGGRIWSDHSSSRRKIRAVFDAPVLARQDINAMLAPVPSRADARSRSGAVKPGRPSQWILSDATINLDRMRGADFDFAVRVGRLTGYSLPLTNVDTRIDLDHGRLAFAPFSAALYGGGVSGTATIDARAALPRLHFRGRVDRIDLARIPSGSDSGRLSATADLAGVGHSLHEAAGDTSGRLAIDLRQARMSRRAGWMLGGDMLRAALSGSRQEMALDCLTGPFAGDGGKLATGALALVTPLGTARGRGFIDLGSETMDLTMEGRPNRRRLFQVAAPVRLAGPWLRPTVTVLPGRNARVLGLGGKAGALLTPLAAALPLGKDRRPAVTCARD